MDKGTILIIEDELVVSMALKKALELSGFEVIEAMSGEDGVIKANIHRPSIVILDLILPKMDGLAVLKVLRKNKWNRNAFVFILTNKLIYPAMLNEMEKHPYLSSYNMKSEKDAKNVVRLLEERVIWEKWNRD